MEDIEFQDGFRWINRSLTIALFIIVAAFMTSCKNEDDLSNTENSSVPEISVQQLHQDVEDGKTFFLLDVRRQEEFETSRLEFSDVRIPYDSLDKFLHLLPSDKNTTIYCFCRRGVRSAVATAELISLGYLDVSNVTGGITAWLEAGYSTESGPIENSTGEK